MRLESLCSTVKRAVPGMRALRSRAHSSMCFKAVISSTAQLNDNRAKTFQLKASAPSAYAARAPASRRFIPSSRSLPLPKRSASVGGLVPVNLVIGYVDLVMTL